jgi:hypothetical protein
MEAGWVRFGHQRWLAVVPLHSVGGHLYRRFPRPSTKGSTHMRSFKINEDGIRAHDEQISAQVQQIVNDTVGDPMDDELDVAVDTLHQRLNAVDGLEFDPAWAQNAIEILRRGDDLTIELR